MCYGVKKITNIRYGCIVSDGIAKYYMILDSITWYYMVTHGVDGIACYTAWYFMVIQSIERYCMAVYGIT